MKPTREISGTIGRFSYGPMTPEDIPEGAELLRHAYIFEGKTPRSHERTMNRLKNFLQVKASTLCMYEHKDEGKLMVGLYIGDGMCRIKHLAHRYKRSPATILMTYLVSSEVHRARQPLVMDAIVDETFSKVMGKQHTAYINDWLMVVPKNVKAKWREMHNRLLEGGKYGWR